VKVLVDTHALIWFITDNKMLPEKSREIIEDASNMCLVSIAALWEMGIKASLDKLDLKVDLEQIFKLVDQTGFKILPISPDHILQNASLKFHHRDPFDRLMIAQAQYEGIKIVTKDRAFKQYNVELVWD
jgi:PIN domain nuclease of toxin-antitoxin system